MLIPFAQQNERIYNILSLLLLITWCRSHWMSTIFGTRSRFKTNVRQRMRHLGCGRYASCIAIGSFTISRFRQTPTWHYQQRSCCGMFCHFCIHCPSPFISIVPYPGPCRHTAYILHQPFVFILCHPYEFASFDTTQWPITMIFHDYSWKRPNGNQYHRMPKI